eukprot:gnl/Hemi2/19544_TR6494_c0_g2_i1.p1 gnl/Hemi2/19544_TR6494_c0_g2~~gnl/Hemi2/19544_TR6494_c0_g2_i1.p1  ORF type:complete len:202 (+),score=2.17 gnl/Hemi2/19544_TR6494_c0_g2_i1:139-744(+)
MSSCFNQFRKKRMLQLVTQANQTLQLRRPAVPAFPSFPKKAREVSLQLNADEAPVLLPVTVYNVPTSVTCGAGGSTQETCIVPLLFQVSRMTFQTSEPSPLPKPRALVLQVRSPLQLFDLDAADTRRAVYRYFSVPEPSPEDTKPLRGFESLEAALVRDPSFLRALGIDGFAGTDRQTGVESIFLLEPDKKLTVVGRVNKI